MIHKTKPELRLYLAEVALKQKFSGVNISPKEVIELQRDCRDYLSSDNIRKIYARMMKIEVTKMMVDAVYQSLTAEEKEFILMKYKKKKQLVAISLALNISVAQLNIHHHSILEKISEFMQYKLTEEDIFKPDKVANMIILLERIVEFAQKYDPQREFMSGGWVEVIAERHDKCCRLLNEIEEVFGGCENSLHKKIISAKIANPDEKIEVLAELCNVDKSIISRHLKNFVDDMRKYLE
ncbi:MAG: hypothetical protein IJQ16_00380 [Selenomonadaceae bacterium]|nr:hypothetical protein [Selenomonadaceae bacterium]